MYSLRQRPRTVGRRFSTSGATSVRRTPIFDLGSDLSSSDGRRFSTSGATSVRRTPIFDLGSDLGSSDADFLPRERPQFVGRRISTSGRAQTTNCEHGPGFSCLGWPRPQCTSLGQPQTRFLTSGQLRI